LQIRGPVQSRLRRSWLWFRDRFDTNLALVVALSVFAWAPLIGPPYFLEAHDAPHSIFFLNQFDQAIRDGVFYPRWGVDFALGYGYPLFNIYSTLAFYAAEIFHLLGAGLVGAVKATYVVAFVVSGLSMYVFGKRVLSPTAGVVAAVVYMFVPYRLLDIYVRSAFAEFCAFSFVPAVLLLFHSLVEKPSLRRLAFSSLAYAALVLTHAPTALVFTLLLAPYVVFLVLSRAREGLTKALKVAGFCLSSALLAMAHSAIFLLPMLTEKGYILESQWTQGSFGYAKHFVYPSQLFSSYWGYGYAGEGLQDEMSLQLGLAATTLAAIGAVYCLGRLVDGWPHVAFFLGATIVIVAAMIPAAQPVWEALPLAALVQFPWRLLGLTAVTMAFLSGAAVHGLSVGTEKRGNGLDTRVAIVSLIVVMASYGYTVPQYTAPSPRSEQPVAIIDFESFYPPDRVGMTIWAEEQPQDSPLVEQYLAGQPLIKAAALSERTQVQLIDHGAAHEKVAVNSANGGEVRFYTYYFPGWRGYVDGQETEIYPGGPYGLITLMVPPGQHLVSIRFGDTPARTVGKVVTVAGLLIAAGLAAWPSVKRVR
jgi:hypothetical protein